MSPVDWNGLWRHTWLAEGHMREGYRRYGEAENALRYDSRDDLWEMGEARGALLEVDGRTVIDVGSGPGILTVPMARRAKRVTAVEPSERMIELLKGHLREEGLRNVDVIRSRWEDVEGLREHDVVVASLSLLMLDIRDAMRRMDRLARERVYIIWFAGTTPWERIRVELDPLVKGTVHTPKPKVDILLGVLHSMGIYPEVRMLDDMPRTYRDREEAMAEARRWMSTEGHDGPIGEFLDRNLVRCEDGLRYREGARYALLSWSPHARERGPPLMESR